ncbi:EH signature domain-containing protein [Pseudoxanthomonas spadix]|uniref:EH signature domain-containing protein n=1 Tax=Pseudoxanthomonas spadix TaxID=415229 RepID=UPI001FD4D584|nr:EH signature domain-containing protein [Pseudoxanthomonas spadix]
MFTHALQRMMAPVHELQVTPVPLKRLREAVSVMREELGTTPAGFDSPQWFNKSLRRLLNEGANALSERDDMILASQFVASSELLNGQSIAARQDLSVPLMQRWQKRIGDSLLGPLLWRTVFVAYFLLGESVEREVYRGFLQRTLPKLKAQRVPPGWLPTVEEHKDVFGLTPSKRYVIEWTAGDERALDALSDHVEIPGSSWFWAEFVGNALAKLEDMNDVEFERSSPRFLSLLSRFPNQQDAVLTALVERAAKSPDNLLNQKILERVIDAWGNPQLDLSDRSHRWSQVSDEARQWICRCLAEEDLADFFELIKSSSRVLSAMDQRRFEYWKRFTGRMQFTKLVLGSFFNSTSNTDIGRFIKKRQGRLGWLTSSTPTNIAMLMKLGDHWFVEFAETGNACYGYEESTRPFKVNDKSLSLYQLKNQRLAKYRLSHHGPWESEFDRTLARVGIRPNGVQQGGRSPTKRAANAPSAIADVDQLLPSLPAHLARELSLTRKAIVDNRNKGGSYWVELSSKPSNELIEAMNVAGFRFASSRGFYR